MFMEIFFSYPNVERLQELISVDDHRLEVHLELVVIAHQIEHQQQHQWLKQHDLSRLLQLELVVFVVDQLVFVGVLELQHFVYRRLFIDKEINFVLRKQTNKYTVKVSSWLICKSCPSWISKCITLFTEYKLCYASSSPTGTSNALHNCTTIKSKNSKRINCPWKLDEEKPEFICKKQLIISFSEAWADE